MHEHNHEHHREHNHEHHHGHEERGSWFRLAVGTGAFLAALLFQDIQIRTLLFLTAWLISGYPVLWAGISGLLHGSFLGEYLLMSVASVGAVLLGDTAEGAAVMLLYGIGEGLQEMAEEKTRNAVTELMKMNPQQVTVLRDGREEQVSPQEAHVGETLLVKPGERVALDGVITSGSAAIDCSALTGESLPIAVQEGDTVSAGSICMDGRLQLRIRAEFENSTLSKMLQLMEDASEKKAKGEKLIARFAAVYTPLVCVLAVLLFAIPVLLFGGAVSDWAHRALGFLVVSCPCALVISVPLSYFGGLGAASRRGILVKNGATLEMLSEVSTVVLDKTGTLTQGNFEVVCLHPHKTDEQALLRMAAAVESASTHPISRSICAYAGFAADANEISDVHEVPGKGISACWHGQQIAVGNEAYLTALGVSVPPCPHAETVIHVAADGIYQGHLVIADCLKPRSVETVQDLRKQGIDKLIMLTGDQPRIAEKVSQSLGMDAYQAGILPEGKVQAVEQLLNKLPAGKRLLFVGDGINDAPVLARADVGAAMGAMGSDIAVEAADVVLMDSDPHKLCDMLRLAARTCGIARQNMWFCMSVKAILLLLSACGLLPMWLAVFGDVGVCLLAIANAARCLRLPKA